MNYKEKYNEALARAKEQLNGAKVFNYDNEQVAHNIRTTVYNIFPKLKESESKDERIRKKLIELFHDTVSNDEIFSDYGLDKTEVLDWLEKQGNNADKVEPKFKVGDWVVFNNHHQSIYQVEKIEDGYYILRHTHGGTFRVCVLHDESLRLWTIEDAKEGDVLATDKGVFIYAKVLYNRPYAYCGIDKFGVFKDNCLNNNWTNSVDNIHPATKEKRDFLFAKMKEEDYQWDKNKKELNKVTIYE